MRACEQVRTDVFYNRLNVKIVGTHSGLSTGQAGSTHFALEDIGIIRSMPQSVILVPADPVAAGKTARLAHEYQGGIYIRLDRNPLPMLYDEDHSFNIGRGHILKDGSDIVLFSIGAVTADVLAAARQLEQMTEKTAAVIDVYSVKPLDEELIRRYAVNCEHAFTVEEHNISGGLFGAVAECISQVSHRCILKPIGIREHYPHGNLVERNREKEGLDTAGILKEVIATVIS